MGGSRKKTVTGYNYYGSMAQVVCFGEVTTLHRITNGETEIFAGPILSSSADGDGKTVLNTTIGTIRFYWGKAAQNVDSVLALLQLDLGSGPQSVPMPRWKNVCYAVCVDVAFGAQVSPPTLKFEIERKLNLLTLSAHDINGDAVLPEVIYDWLTNSLYGSGIPAAKINTASFVTAAEAVITEGLGVSPFEDANTTLGELLGKLRPYIDCHLYFEVGQIFIKLVRKESEVGIVSIDETDLTDEPKPANEGWLNTWNFTTIKFTDRENEWQDGAVEPYDDPANAAITQERISKELDYSYVTLRSVAKKLSRRKGIAAGIPAMIWKLSLLPSFKTLIPGQIFKLTYAKRGITNRLMRVIRRGKPNNNQIEIDALEEATRDESNDYVPPNDTFGVDDLVDENGNEAFQLASTTPRLSWLAADLKAGATDGFLVAAQRPNSLTDGFHVWFTWDPVQKTYTELAVSTGFPSKAVVKSWHRARNNTSWILRIEIALSSDKDFLTVLMAGESDVYFAVGRRLYKTVGSALNQHQVDALWFTRLLDGLFSALTPTIYDVEVTDSTFQATAPALETLAGNGNYPTQHIYAGRKTDFVIYPTDSWIFEKNAGGGQLIWSPTHGTAQPDTAKVRYVKTPCYNFKDVQTLAAVTAATFDRDDTTMCPNGTYSTDWGLVVKSTYELFDDAGGSQVQGGAHPDYTFVEDVDYGLYAILWGFDTITQDIKFDDIDELLGFMVQTGQTYYNKTA